MTPVLAAPFLFSTKVRMEPSRQPARVVRGSILPTASGSYCPRDISPKQKQVRLEPVAVCVSRSVPESLRILKTIARLPNLARRKSPSQKYTKSVQFSHPETGRVVYRRRLDQGGASLSPENGPM